MRRRVLLVLVVLLTPASALAQDRTAAQRQTLLELSRALGESHAYRQACAGSSDQFWRGRMLRLVEVESPDPAFEARLKGAFNDAFLAKAGIGCAESARPAQAAAGRGSALAGRLAQATVAAN